MIDRAEILAIATDLRLSHDVVEKDYVLGWLLAGIYAHEQLASTWVFKGGTCLKKCYFETYRFSEDLDFTLLSVIIPVPSVRPEVNPARKTARDLETETLRLRQEAAGLDQALQEEEKWARVEVAVRNPRNGTACRCPAALT